MAKQSKHKHSDYQEQIIALYADEAGEIYDAPGICGVGRVGDELQALTPDDLIPLPESADLMFLPDRPWRLFCQQGIPVPCCQASRIWRGPADCLYMAIQLW